MIGTLVFAIVTVVVCAASWLAGRLAHEATHAMGCVVAGARITSMGHSHVEYVAPSERWDSFIRASVVLVFFVLVGAGVRTIATRGFQIEDVYFAVFLAAYFPFSPGDWAGLRELVTRTAGDSEAC